MILALQKGIADSMGRWKLIKYDERFNATRLREIKVWELGRIPWRNIREYDMNGDEYYNMPHIYCDFADKGMPYEDFVYYMLDDDYDWPLDKEKRLPK